MDSKVIDFYKPNTNGKNGDVDRAIRNARRATCGLAEKEVMVKAQNVSKIAKGLQNRGYTVIGTSYDKPGTKFKKLWFIQQGLGSL